MDLAIHFDGGSGSVTVEVNDKPADHLLTMEVQTSQPMRAEVLPEDPFLDGHLAAKLLCLRHFHGSYFLATEDIVSPHSIDRLFYGEPSSDLTA
jgi:hypothetical protein